MTQLGTVRLTLDADVGNVQFRIEEEFHTTAENLPAEVKAILTHGATELLHEFHNLQTGGVRPVNRDAGRLQGDTPIPGEGQPGSAI